MFVNIKWRPQNNAKINATASLTIKTDDGVVYELNESAEIDMNDNNTTEYRIGSIRIQVLCPFRRLRIKIRGYLKKKGSNELVFAKIGLFWIALSNTFDFQNDFDDKFIAKELSKSSESEVQFENRIEQFGQLKGVIQIENDSEKELYLWGIRAKSFLTSGDENISAVRIYGYNKKGFAFHLGNVSIGSNTK